MAATEIFQLLGKIGLDGVEEAHKQIDGVNNKAGTLGTVFNKAGKVVAGIGKAVAVGMGAAATAVGGIIKASVDGYAEYEQLVGGAQLMFGDAYDFVADKAANAYATVQMSQSEYLQQVNGFAVGLKTALGGDAQAAAELANDILVAEADIVAATGQTSEAVQNAFNGIMKGNFTMVDNLQIGIKPTKEGYQEMIDKVNEWNAAQGNATNYTIDNIADCQAALVDYVAMQGMAGYAADEAAGTIQGSTAMMKASWSNLITGFADESQDLNLLVGNFVDSAVTMIGNIADRVQEILPRLVEGLNLLITELTPHLTEIISTMLPGLIQGATTLLIGLIEALPAILQLLIEQLPFILTSIGTALVEAFPALLQTVKMLFGEIWDYIAESLFGVEGNFDETFAKVEEIFNNVWVVLQETWDAIGQPIWDLIQSCVDTVRGVFAEKMPEIKEFVSSCFSDISDFWNNNLKPCFDAIGNFIQNVLAPIFKLVFEGFIRGYVETAFGFIKDLWNNTLKPVFTGITDFLTGVFTLNFKQAFQGIVSAVQGIWNGIVNVVKTPINLVINIINGFIQGLNRLQIPDWVPLVGGKGINIPLIPQLEEGGILEKGQVGFLEGNGAEAVVPLDQNEKWINKVAMDMNAAVGGGNNEKLQEIVELLKSLIEMFPETMIDAFKSMKFDVNNREFARLVKAVN